MKTWFRFSVGPALLIAAMGLAACSDDDNGPTGTGNDTTPPSVASVSGDDSLHISVRFNEPVDRTSAEAVSNYVVTQASAGLDTTLEDSPAVAGASLLSDNKTVVLTTDDAMGVVLYRIVVNNVADTEGNAISTPVDKSFTGSDHGDVTAPEVVMRSPTENQSNVGLTAPIEVQFSEPVALGVVTSGFIMEANGTPVTVNVTSEDNLHFTVTPVAPLLANTVYTVSLTGLYDTSNNMMATDEWTFRTGAGTSVTSVSR
ncbi:MAG TPA: Ig-like domain-containing protein [Candidatus Krumholzibacteria bacterium]